MALCWLPLISWCDSVNITKMFLFWWRCCLLRSLMLWAKPQTASLRWKFQLSCHVIFSKLVLPILSIKCHIQERINRIYACAMGLHFCGVIKLMLSGTIWGLYIPTIDLFQASIRQTISKLPCGWDAVVFTQCREISRFYVMCYLLFHLLSSVCLLIRRHCSSVIYDRFHIIACFGKFQCIILRTLFVSISKCAASSSVTQIAASSLWTPLSLWLYL